MLGDIMNKKKYLIVFPLNIKYLICEDVMLFVEDMYAYILFYQYLQSWIPGGATPAVPCLIRKKTLPYSFKKNLFLNVSFA